MCKTGCDAERAAFEKMLAAHENFHKQIVARVKKERPADVNDLLKPRRKKLGSYQITVTYFNFPIWLSRFDPKLSRGLDVNINSYRYQRDKHIEASTSNWSSFAQGTPERPSCRRSMRPDMN